MLFARKLLKSRFISLTSQQNSIISLVKKINKEFSLSKDANVFVYGSNMRYCTTAAFKDFLCAAEIPFNLRKTKIIEALSVKLPEENLYEREKYEHIIDKTYKGFRSKVNALPKKRK